MMPSTMPPGAAPIDVEDFYRTIGELYFQCRVYQRVIAQFSQQQQAQQAARNGTADDAVHLEL